VGGPRDQSDYLNTVIQITTPLPPLKLLKFCQDLEEMSGRERDVKWGPRTLDIDILLFNDITENNPILIIPHPEMHNRRFVLEPLAEIAPDLIHPTLKISISQILNKLE
ncbi:MAG: 2-amino-4-hydroxy-6-hydroxymethyldihydropteridine diphosphokinase, partial [Planctomycetota bacterium]